jgi:hypothetical protein
MFGQDFSKRYEMITASERLAVIQKINKGEMVSETATGKKERWWTEKHHPANDVPANIYLLGKGTVQELHDQYIRNYGGIEWSEFINYTRELIKQQIMV